MNSKIITIFEELRKDAVGYWSERITAQLTYAIQLSKVNGGKFDSIIEEAIEYLNTKKQEEGAINKNIVLHLENTLLEISSSAKNIKVICASHAHIDMNWMWGFAETVAITLDTFRTMLNLMKEYPDFKFSQSQASTYKIVEEYDNDMLQEIKARIKEGRWEVTASTWVETDKNMPSGESLARHILYTKKYLSNLLELDPNSLQLDFEPDTFGHNINVPEILSNGGVKYYYHCRGYEGHNIYKWKSPSGHSVIVYNEPIWYNSTIDTNFAAHVPEFCFKYGMNTSLKVYGVGDHGGGPTRRDIEKLIDMNAWPIFPTIKFGTFSEFFRTLEKVAETLPEVDQELNFIFTGCYTTQTRIKLSNRISEAKLKEAEAFSAFSRVFAGGKYPLASYGAVWEKVLFNHFHDILTGSGVIETREYAMGEFQKVLAVANTGIKKAFNNIASQINTSSIEIEKEDCKDSISEGGGVGYSVKDFGVPQTERGVGKTRIINFFNSSFYDRHEPVEISIWDWPGVISRMEIKDVAGSTVKYQILDNERPDEEYWGHKFLKLLVDVNVPANGYSTYVLRESNLKELNCTVTKWESTHLPDKYVLENDFIRVDFDTNNASINSIFDKKNKVEMVKNDNPACVFRFIEEDDNKGMTSWIVGRYINVLSLHTNVKIEGANMNKDSLRQWIKYKINFRQSTLRVTVSLDNNEAKLNFEVECDWQENAQIGKFIPQLNFYMPVGYASKTYQYDIPFGTIIREGLDMDVPANSWAMAIPDTCQGSQESQGSQVMVVTNTKYGFRGVHDSIAVTLIRSSYDPDPYPEIGIHNFKFAVKLLDTSKTNEEVIENAYNYNHPICFVSNSRHEGTLPMNKSFMSLEGGSVVVSAVKMPEIDIGTNRLVIRVYETSGNNTQAILKFDQKVSKCWYVDINETNIETSNKLNDKIQVEGNIVTFGVDSYSIASICIEF